MANEFGSPLRMMHHDEAVTTDRMRRALLAFQSALNLLLEAHQRLHGRPTEESEAFWLTSGGHIERHVHTTATEAVAAFHAFSKAGLVAGVGDQHRVTQARQYLAEVVADVGPSCRKWIG